MATITLPIKCSTVKKADSVLNRIIDVEVIVSAILFVLWSITLNYRYIVAPDSMMTSMDMFSMCLSWFGCFILTFVVLVSNIPEKLYAMLPSLACIKDEEDTS